MLNYIYSFNPTLTRYNMERSNSNYERAVQYDADNKPINLKKHNYSDMINNTALVYNDYNKAVEYSNIYKTVLDKFILGYLQIPGLSSLYDEHYMEFEWNMHSDMDFEKHTNSYYRDHFVHEIRNMYMMLKMLEDDYISYNVKRSFINSDRSKVAQYYKHQYIRWKRSIENHSLEDFLFSLIGKSPTNEQKEECLENYFFGYISKATSIFACLFHDIGYPISYYLSIKNRIINFIPAVYSIMGDNNFDFSYINSILSESVLFQFVGKDEIYKKFGQNDHGTISAILIGIFFYKTGTIKSLPIEQQTVIELGILAMYNHTLKFSNCYPKEETKYFRMNFALNPISYLLRLCDDVQEWDREYFNIAPVSNLLYCQKCHTPLRKAKIGYKKYYERYGLDLNLEKLDKRIQIKKEKKEKYSLYWCDCNRKANSDCDAAFMKHDDFSRRKIIEIKPCDSVVVTFNQGKYGNNGNMEIDIKYNPYKLLRMCLIQLDFFDHRIKEIISIKKYVEGQSFVKGKKGYHCIYVKHNVSCNPMLLKMFILRDFFEAIQKYGNDEKCTEKEKLIKKVWNNYDNFKNCIFELIKLFNKMIEEDEHIDINNLPDEIKEQIAQLSEKIVKECYVASSNKKITDFSAVFKYNCEQYINLWIYECLQQKGKSKSKSFTIDFIDDSIACNDVRTILYKGAIAQLKNTYIPGEMAQIGTKEYNNYLKEDDSMIYHIKEYCNPEAPLNLPDMMEEKLTYYTDKSIFEKISYLTEIINDIFDFSD